MKAQMKRQTGNVALHHCWRNEISTGTFILRNMTESNEVAISASDIVSTVLDDKRAKLNVNYLSQFIWQPSELPH